VFGKKTSTLFEQCPAFFSWTWDLIIELFGCANGNANANEIDLRTLPEGTNEGPVRLTLKLACSASFFNRNSIFFSQHFSQNSVFQLISAKFQPEVVYVCVTATETK